MHGWKDGWTDKVTYRAEMGASPKIYKPAIPFDHVHQWTQNNF